MKDDDLLLYNSESDKQLRCMKKSEAGPDLLRSSIFEENHITNEIKWYLYYLYTFSKNEIALTFVDVNILKTLKFFFVGVNKT